VALLDLGAWRVRLVTRMALSDVEAWRRLFEPVSMTHLHAARPDATLHLLE
jgi:hypothetical protein